MKIFSDIGSKFVWFIIALLALGFGYVFVLKNFLNPPPATVAPISTSSSPVQALPPAQSPNSLVASSSTGEPSPILVPDSQNSSTLTDPNSLATSGADSSPMPALALPDEVALKVPEKLEKGGILKLYSNNDESRNPDPIEYSPSKVLKTPGVAFINVDKGQFQEISGYFLVDQTGNYNFSVSHPDIYGIELKHLRTKVDGTTLATTKGGRIALEQGWHYVTVFMFVNPDAIDANAVRVSWGQEGETLKPLAIWREVQ